MKCAIVIFFVIASTATTFAVAQDGTGQGPPKHPKSIIVIGPLPTPTPKLPGTVPLPKLLQPKLR